MDISQLSSAPPKPKTPTRHFYLNHEIIEWLESLRSSQSACAKAIFTMFMDQTAGRDPIELGKELEALARAQKTAS